MPTHFPQWCKKLGCFLTILLLTKSITLAQPLNLQPEMELNYGLRHNSVRTIIQDSSQRTWLGTEAGLIALNSHNPYIDSLVKQLEKEAVLSLAILNNYLFVGTVSNGLKIFDLNKHKQIHHPRLKPIRFVRHIRVLQGEVYVAANSDSWKITVSPENIQLTKIHRPEQKGFIVDFYTYDKKIYAFDIKVSEYSRFFDIKGKKAVPIDYLPGYPYKDKWSFLSSYGNDSLLIIGSDMLYGIIKKNKSEKYEMLFDTASQLSYPAWDLTMAKDKIFLALGQQYQLNMGLTYEVGVNSLKDIRNDFFCQALYYNKKHDALWIGTYNRGLYIWPSVTLSKRIPIKLDGTVKITSGPAHIKYVYNEKYVYSWDQEKNSVDLIKETKSDPEQANIISVDYKNDSLAILSTNNFSYLRGDGKNIYNYPFKNYRYSHYQHLGDTLFFFYNAW